MAGKFLVTLLVTAFITTSVDAAAQGDQTLVIRISSNGTPVPALPLFIVDSRNNLVQIGETASTGEFEFPRNSADPKWRAASDYFRTETPSFLRMERCSTATTRNAALRDTLRGIVGTRSGSSICGADCKCEDYRAVESVPTPIRRDFDFAEVRPYFTLENLDHLKPSQEPDRPNWNFDLHFQYSFTSELTPLTEAAGVVESQLRALNYNTVQSEVDDTATGWGLGAGVTWNLTDRVGIRGGYTFTNLGPWTAHVEGTRLNQPNTPSNLAFDTRSRFFDVNQSLFEFLAPLIFGRVTINPGVMVVYVNGKVEYTSGLLGAPIGQTPTTQVASGNEQSDFSGWGLGWQVGAAVELNSHVGVGVSYQRTRVDDVIISPSGSYVTLSDVNTSQVVGRITIRP